MHEVVRLKLGKGSERVLVVQLPHEVHLIFRHGLQVGIAPNLAVGRGVVDAAHRAPITGIDGLAAEREIEHILRVDVPHRVELRIDAPLVPFRGMVLLHRQRGVEAQRLANLLAQSGVGIQDALVVIYAAGGVGHGLLVLVEGGLIAVVVRELRLCPVVQFPVIGQRVGLVGGEEPLADLLTTIN